LSLFTYSLLSLNSSVTQFTIDYRKVFYGWIFLDVHIYNSNTCIVKHVEVCTKMAHYSKTSLKFSLNYYAWCCPLSLSSFSFHSKLAFNRFLVTRILKILILFLAGSKKWNPKWERHWIQTIFPWLGEVLDPREARYNS